MPLLPFGGWSPDTLDIITDPQQERFTAGEALGVLPGPSSYRSWPGPAAASLAVPATVRGASAPRTTTNAIAIFAGTATKLYKFASPTTNWTDVSRAAGGNYAVGTDDMWQFQQFGANLYAVNGADAIQYIDATSGTNFAPVSGVVTSGTIPTWARYMAACGDMLMFANTSNSPREVIWPARNDVTRWLKGYGDADANQFPDGGDIMGITGIEQGGLIFQTETVRQYFALQNRAIFQFRRAEASQGTSSPYGIIPYQGGAFYYGNRGFAAIGADGTSQPIGDGWVNEWFLANSNIKTRPKAMIGAMDPAKLRFFWLFASSGNPSNIPDQIICFDPSTVGTDHGPWTHAAISAEMILAAASTASTLAGLTTAYSTEIGVPFPFGADIWKGGAPGLTMFDSAHKLNFFSGANLAATIDTAIMSPIPGKRTFIRGYRPVCDVTVAAGQSSNITGRVGYMERAQDAIQWTGSSTLNVDGVIEARASGRLLRVEVNIPAGQTWTHLGGLEDLDIEDDGER